MISGIKFTSDIEEIFKIFMSKTIYISDKKYMLETFNNPSVYELVDFHVRNNHLFISTDNPNMVGELAFEITTKGNRKFVKDIVVCQSNGKSYATVIFNPPVSYNADSSNGITMNMLMYFIDTYDFVSNCTYNKKYSIKDKLKRTFIVADGDNGPANLCISAIPVYKSDDDSAYDNIYLSFGEDGKLIDCKTYFDPSKNVFVIYDPRCGGGEPEKEPEKEVQVKDDNADYSNIEEIFDDILNAIKSLQTSITNLSDEVHNKFAELSLLRKSSDD